MHAEEGGGMGSRGWATRTHASALMRGVEGERERYRQTHPHTHAHATD